ncbi:MAG: phytanoyl-CoA dioxygenase family protein [Myxococcota bacterium]|nr:phytanoyl-CoA dioxygenase family protein [Myxococcales bacterium]
MDERRLERHVGEIADQGFTFVEGAIEPALVAELRDTIRSVARALGTAPKGNPAEGYATRRNYNLLAKADVFARMPIHDHVLPVVERVLDPGCLLSGMTAIDIGPGERPQPLHPDDVCATVPRPHPPLMCVAMWALTDFTDANGATRYVPGTHRASAMPDFGTAYDTLPAEMEAGTVMIFDAALWHGGGANTTADDWRLGVNVQYCHGWMRTQQNHYLGVPRDALARMPERLLELLGMNLYKGIMGHVDGRSPGAVLGDARVAETAYAGDRPARQGLDALTR